MVFYPFFSSFIREAFAVPQSLWLPLHMNSLSRIRFIHWILESNSAYSLNMYSENDAAHSGQVDSCFSKAEKSCKLFTRDQIRVRTKGFYKSRDIVPLSQSFYFQHFYCYCFSSGEDCTKGGMSCERKCKFETSADQCDQVGVSCSWISWSVWSADPCDQVRVSGC